MTRGDYYELYDSNPTQNGRISFTCAYRLYRITHWCDQKRGHAIYFRFPFEDCVAGIDNFADLGKSDYLLYNGPLWQNGHCTDSHVLHHGSRRYPWKQNLPLKRNNI